MDPLSLKPAALYVRVSSKPQEAGDSLPTQLDACRRYCAERGLQIVPGGELHDVMTGRKASRPGLLALRQMVRDGRIQAIVFFSRDRAGRNMRDSLEFSEEFEQAGIELHYVGFGLVSYSPEGHLADRILHATASFELEQLRERSIRCRQAKALRGEWVGSGRTNYGLARVGQGREAVLAHDPVKGRVMQEIFAMYTGTAAPDGTVRPRMKLIPIARKLEGRGIPAPFGADEWTGGTISRLLRNRAYIGEFHYGKIPVHKPELALVSREVFELAQQLLVANRGGGGRPRYHDYLLSGRLRCGACGAPVVGGGSRYCYYRCTRHTKLTARACAARMVRSDLLDRLAWEWFIACMDEALIREAVQRVEGERRGRQSGSRARVEAIGPEIAALDRKIRRLVSMFGGSGDDSAGRAEAEAIRAEVRQIGRQRDALEAEREGLARELAAPEMPALQIEALLQAAARVRALQAALRAGGDAELRRDAVEAFDLRAVLREDERGQWLDLRLQATGQSAAVAVCAGLRYTPRSQKGTEPVPDLADVLFSVSLPVPAPERKLRARR